MRDPELAGEQAGHQVRVVVAGDGDERRGFVDPLGLEQGQVGGVAVEHLEAGEGGGHLGAGAGPLDDRHAVAPAVRAPGPP
jgi:hypothetical protein